MIKTYGINGILAVVWLALAAALWFGWLPRPGGEGNLQSDVGAGLALLMVAWNLLRVTQKARLARLAKEAKQA